MDSIKPRWSAGVAVDIAALPPPGLPANVVQRVGVAGDQCVGVAARQGLGDAALNEAANNPRAINGTSRDQQGTNANNHRPGRGLFQFGGDVGDLHGGGG
jgi:hypothetical protein